jgi:hypothetical protein
MKYYVNESQYNKIRNSIKPIMETKINEEETPELTPKQKKIINVLNKVQEGLMTIDDLDLYIGGLEVLIKKLKEENVLHYLNPFDRIWEDYENQILYAFCQIDSNFVWEIVDKYLTDVKQEGGKYYYLADPEDLAGLFRTSYRDDISESTLKDIISGEYNYDYYYQDVTDNVFRDVYDELTPENKIKVNQTIKEELLKIKEIEVNSSTPDLFEEIANEQGHEGDVELTPEVIDRLFNDKECLEYIILEVADEIRNELYSVYSDCHNSILQNSWYEDIMNELKGFVIDDVKPISYTYERKVYNKEGKSINKQMYGTKYEATNCIRDVILEFLESNKNYTQGDTISYYSSYRGLLNGLIHDGGRDELRVPRLDEWPDSRKVDKCINDNF